MPLLAAGWTNRGVLHALNYDFESAILDTQQAIAIARNPLLLELKVDQELLAYNLHVIDQLQFLYKDKSKKMDYEMLTHALSFDNITCVATMQSCVSKSVQLGTLIRGFVPAKEN